MFSASQWGDPSFLAFVKEYWELNFKEKFKNLVVTVVFNITADGAEVMEDIVVYFVISSGKITPYLVRGKPVAEITNAVFFTGPPDLWDSVAQQGSIEALHGRIVAPDDAMKRIKAEVTKTFFAIGNRVADRMNQGNQTSLNVANSVKFGEPGASPEPSIAPATSGKPKKPALEMLDEAKDVSLNIGGMQIGNRKMMAKMLYDQFLKDLRDFGSKNLNKFWKKVEKLPDKEKYRKVMDPMKLPMQLFADPNLRSDLLAMRGKSKDQDEIFKRIEAYLEEKSKS